MHELKSLLGDLPSLDPPFESTSLGSASARDRFNKIDRDFNDCVLWSSGKKKIGITIFTGSARSQAEQHSQDDADGGCAANGIPGDDHRGYRPFPEIPQQNVGHGGDPWDFIGVASLREDVNVVFPFLLSFTTFLSPSRPIKIRSRETIRLYLELD